MAFARCYKSVGAQKDSRSQQQHGHVSQPLREPWSESRTSLALEAGLSCVFVALPSAWRQAAAIHVAAGDVHRRACRQTLPWRQGDRARSLSHNENAKEDCSSNVCRTTATSRKRAATQHAWVPQPE